VCGEFANCSSAGEGEELLNKTQWENVKNKKPYPFKDEAQTALIKDPVRTAL